MAKKSRRQKLPSEKDFEKLNNPKQEEPEVPAQEEQAPDAVQEGRSQPTYSIDGGISVSLAGDVTGVGNVDDSDAGSDDIVLDEDSFAELFGESPQDFLRQVSARPLGDTLAEPVFEPRNEPAPSSTEDFHVDQGDAVTVEEEEELPEEEPASDEPPKPPEVLILVGSPHTDGKSALFGRKLSEYLRLSGAAVTLFEIAKYPVAACTGCDACRVTGTCCIKGDAWNVLSRHMESCAALVVIAPVYFAGPSGWLKAALDRCQMYWARKYVLGEWVPRKRPAHLVVIGDGGDPFGTEPLETICTSALNCANLRIDSSRITRMIGDQFDLSRAITLAGQVMASIGRA